MTNTPLIPEHLGQIQPQELASMSGVEFFQRLISGELPSPTICGTVPMRVRAVEHGRIVWETSPTDGLLNPMGVVHGGYAMTVLDTCLGCAVHTSLPAGRAYTTLEVKANMVRAIRAEQGLLLAEGRVIQTGRRIATAEGKLTDADGKVYAFGTTTCLVFDA